MTAAARPEARVARALTRDLAGYAVFWALSAVAGLVALTVVVAAVGDVDSSLWHDVTGILRWLVLAGGVIVATSFVPLYVAHGIPRRAVALGVVPVVLGLAVVAGAAATGVLALEGLVYGALGWPHVIENPGRFLYDGPDQYGLVLASMSVQLAGYGVTGWLMGAGYLRLGRLGGTLFLPVAALPGLVIEMTVGGGWLDTAEVLALDEPSPVLVVAASLVALAAGLAAAGALVRDAALDNDNVAWWR